MIWGPIFLCLFVQMTSIMPLPAIVHRIQRRQVVIRSPCASEHTGRASVSTLDPTPFTIPTVHMWSVRLSVSDKPHVVIFADVNDAQNTARAIASFSRSTKRVPQTESDLRSLFCYHFKPDTPRPRSRPQTRSLHAESCDLTDVVKWTASRRIGILAITKIKRDASGGAVVEYAFETNDNDDMDADILANAVRQDFAWQLPTTRDLN